MLAGLRKYKVRFCRWLLHQLYPDQNALMGEAIEDAVAKKSEEWEIALLSIQAEIAEEFDGGLLHGVPSVPALCEKIKRQTRAWKLQDCRERKLLQVLHLDVPGEIVPRVRGLVNIDYTRERERAMFDEAYQELRKAKNAFNQALALLQDLQRSYDLEYRVKNVLDFEGKLDIEKEAK